MLSPHSKNFGPRDTSSRFYRTAIATCSRPPGRTSALRSITSFRSRRPAIQAALEDLRQGRRDHRPRPAEHSVRRQPRPPLHRGKILWDAHRLHRPAQAAVRPNPASARSGGGRFRRTCRRLGLTFASPLAFARVHRHGAAMTTAASELYDLGVVRHDWTRAEVRALFELAFPEFIFCAQRIHRLHFDPTEVQISTLISIKTGGCPEDCAYCPQSAHYQTSVKAEKLMRVDAVVAEARAAK